MINSYEEFVKKYKKELDEKEKEITDSLIREKEITDHVLMIERYINEIYETESTENFYLQLLKWYEKDIIRLNYANFYFKNDADKYIDTVPSMLHDGYYVYLKRLIPD